MKRGQLRKLLDFLSDPRMPYNPAPVIRSHRVRSLLRRKPAISGRKILLCLTFDVEIGYGSYRISDRTSHTTQFLHMVEDHPDWRTLFVEGRLVKENSSALRSLTKKGCELGLHGYSHELWGGQQWYLPDKALTVVQRAALLRAGIKTFEIAGLEKPILFRAPNLVADGHTIQLLSDNGFTVDSSLPSHRGVMPIPRLFPGRKQVIQIPVTVDPIPEYSRKRILPYRTFRQCNLKTLRQMTGKDLPEYVMRIAAIQQALGFAPHLVVLAHSWEFFDPPDKRSELNYCSPTNLQTINNLVRSLSDNFDVQPVSIGKLATLL